MRQLIAIDQLRHYIYVFWGENITVPTKSMVSSKVGVRVGF